MSNKIRALLFGLCTAFILTACSPDEMMEQTARKVYEITTKDSNIEPSITPSTSSMDNTTEGDNGIAVYNVDGDLLEREISVIDASKQEPKSEETIQASDISELYSDDNINNLRYAYSKLTPSEQNTYMEIYAILTDMLEDVVLTSKDTDEIDRVFKCVLVDHPEIFYVKGYSIGKYMYGDTIDKISISGTYIMDKNQVEEKKKIIDSYVTRVINNAPLSDDYSKIKYVYEYLIHNNEYIEGAPNNQNILSVVENGQTVCQGYAKMTQLLLNKLGIFCTLVNGEAKGSNGVGGTSLEDDNTYGSHVWNIVKCGDKYYNVDTTWGDAAFSLINNETGDNPIIDINYEFLLVDDNALKGTHRPEPVVTMPVCDSIKDNYYVREGVFFESVNEEQLATAFEHAYVTGEDIICLKAANDSVYEALNSHLFKNQKIFDYLPKDNIKYVEYPERRMMLVSL